MRKKPACCRWKPPLVETSILVVQYDATEAAMTRQPAVAAVIHQAKFPAELVS
jgi:hypothetical protein